MELDPFATVNPLGHEQLHLLAWPSISEMPEEFERLNQLPIQFPKLCANQVPPFEQ
jgi:hypothetical protein